jgi:hypothetical protein
MGPEEYTTPQRMDTPIPDSLFRAATPIGAYKSVGSNFLPTPPLSFSPTAVASGSGLHLKEEPPVARTGQSKDSPVNPPVERSKRAKDSPTSPPAAKTRRREISDEHPILTTKHYGGHLKPVLDTIHPSLTVMAISAGHLILGRSDELSALATVASCKPKLDAQGQARQDGSFLQHSGILDKEGLYLQTPRDFLQQGYQFMEVKSSTQFGQGGRNSSATCQGWSFSPGTSPHPLIVMKFIMHRQW